MSRSLSLVRIYILGILLLLLFAVLVGKLWYVQVARGPEYTARIQSSSRVTVRIPPVRGEILDRNGIKLAENRASFEVEFFLPDLVKAYRERKGSVPTTTSRVVRGMLEERQEADVAKIVDELIIKRLEELGIAENYNAQRMQVHYRNDAQLPFTYIQDIDFETLAKFSENNIDLPGVNISVRPVRHYPYGSLAAHILGYVGAPREIDREEAAKYNFYQPDHEGKSQIEFYMNDYLRGTAGTKILQRNAKGVIEGEIGMIEPKQGANVYLTIDARLQHITEQALRVVGRGAAVVVDPNNGDVLAMASVPSFDPNIFIPSISPQAWADLLKDKTDPLVNRAISAYPPGSTYKVPIAIAGERAGVGNRSFTCSGGVQYGNHFMKCHRISGHGSLNLQNALKVSCNGFFYQFGNAAGIDQIVATGNMLGLGRKTNIPLSGEVPGILPGPEWLAQVSPRERWSSGYTANTSIGQGAVLATPLQMAMLTATVANGGVSYEPRLVDRVVAQDGEILLQEPAKVRADLKTDGGMTEAQIENVRRGMWKVVNEGGGTGSRARFKNIEVAGKTGTAQYFRDGGVKDNIAWFIAFAPYENPRYAICVMVQGGEAGGQVAAPIAGKILEEAFKLDEAEEPYQVTPLPPAQGNFQKVASVNFGRDVPAALAEADPETPSVTTSQTPQQARASAAPSIRETADERGTVKNKKRERGALERFFGSVFGGGKKKEQQKSDQPSRQQNKPSR